MTTSLPRTVRTLCIAGVTTSIAAVGWALPVSSASAAAPTQVLVFADASYVDYGTRGEVAAGEEDHEGINLQLALEAAGNTVSTVQETSASAFSAALAGKQTFVIPETEDRGLEGNFDAATVAVVQDWVRAGGTLIVAGDYGGDNVNALLGSTIDSPDSSPASGAWSLSATPGPAFVGGPASLADNDGTAVFATSTLPSGAVPVYADADSGSGVVYDVALGAGEVVSLGWDWYDALPANQDGQDGGWNAVLERAVSTSPATAPIPAPTPADTTAPQTTITKVAAKKVKAGAKGKKAKAAVTVSFRADEAARFACSVDGKAFRACSSPFKVRLKKGSHVIAVRATDAAGNTDATPATRTFTVKKAKRK